MALVPIHILEEMNKWKKEQNEKPQLPPDPQITNTAHLQNDMSSVFERTDLSESEKIQKHGEMLHKFKTSYEKVIQPQKTTELTQPVISNINSRILQSIPKTMGRKAELLLNMLKDNPKMSWDEYGVVTYKGKIIAGSNIIDLVNDTLRQRKGFNPRGWETFSTALRDINIPQDIVGNTQRWNWMNKYQSDSDSDTSFSTPKSVRKSTSTTFKKERFLPKKWDAY